MPLPAWLCSLCAGFHKDVNYCNSFHLNKQMVSSCAVWLIVLCVPGNADAPFPLGKWKLSCSDIVIISVPLVIWIPMAKAPEPSVQSTRHVFVLHRKVRESGPSFAGCFFMQIFCHWPYFRKVAISVRVWALQNWTQENNSKSLYCFTGVKSLQIYLSRLRCFRSCKFYFLSEMSEHPVL